MSVPVVPKPFDMFILLDTVTQAEHRLDAPRPRPSTRSCSPAAPFQPSPHSSRRVAGLAWPRLACEIATSVDCATVTGVTPLGRPARAAPRHCSDSRAGR
jgi:hypothetical protein